jgi:hypothetical protein
VPATVPGAVQLDWARAEGWGDPHYGENWRAYGWMEDVHWVYRATLALDEIDDGQRVFFVCGGIDYRFQIRLAEECLLEQEGMFTPVEIDLTGRAHSGDSLEVVVFPVPKSHPEPADRTQANSSCKPAVSYGWDFHPRLVPSGIWCEAGLEVRSKVHITATDVRYALDPDLKRAQVSLSCDISEPGLEVRWHLIDPDGAEVLSLTAKRRLRGHPSLVVWCGGNELFNVWSGMTDQDLPLRLLNRNCYELDPGRPFLPTAPVAGMGHGHYVFRDAKGDEVFQILARASCTAYTEFGCPAPADTEVLRETLPKDELFPPRPGTSWESHHAFEAWAPNSHLLLDVIEDYFGSSETLEQLVERGQLLQSQGIKCLYEEARRQKPRAAMALSWCFSEPWPAAANLSLVGWPDRPKPALSAVGASCRPVLASARIARFTWREGDVFEPELWLLNDTAQELPAGRVEAILHLDDQEIPLLAWHHPVVPANRNLVGPTVRSVLPRAAAGRMTLRLRCPGHGERDSEYVLLYRQRETVADVGTRTMNT